ncbi:MAG: hypothetical protein IKA76_03055 [Clostridia bacterium]|nr:hypothetical protein [Clostridia bacterium]
MNRTQKFALNSITAMICQLVVMVAGMITPRLMISTYGSEVNGLVSSLNQFISYITLVEAGIGGAAIYSLYNPLAEEDHGRISSIVKAARNSYRQAGYIFSAGILALAVVYGVLSQSETLSFWMIFSLALLLGINGCADFFFVSGYRVLLNADQRNFIISVVSIIQTVLRTALICLLAMGKVNVIILYAIVATLVLVKIVMISAYSKKQYPYIDHTAKPDKGAMEKRWDVIYQQILGMVQSGAPTVLATILLSLKTVSVYSVYNMVITGLNGVLGVFISGLSAGFGDLIARREKEKLKKTVSEFEVAYYFILSVVYGLAFVLMMPFVRIYTAGVTDANYILPALSVTIVLNGLLYNIKTPQSMLVISAGMYRETRWRVTIQGAIIIVCGALLGWKFGIVGIMIGSCLSNLYRTVDLLFFTPKYISHNSVARTAFRMLMVFVNIALIVLPTLFIEIQAKNFFEWILVALIFAVYAVAITMLTTLIADRKSFLAVMKRIFRTLLRRR